MTFAISANAHEPALVLSTQESAQSAEPSPFVAKDFTFESGGSTLSGVLDVPETGDAEALIVFVHGYGKTDVRGWNMYADLRERFHKLGIATVTWDKPGLGKSEGQFDINQPVQQSAQEVLDAVAVLRESRVAGSDKIGIWGVSRAGWIAPIAMSQDHDIDFWISVAGVTAEDNYLYLMLSNLPLEGGTVEEAEVIKDEWRCGFEILRTGGSYEEYAAATTTLRASSYIRKMMGSEFTAAEFLQTQSAIQTDANPPTDPETGMLVYVDEFDEMLAGLNVDVLALFGEKDLNVDWQKTRRFYEATIGQNPEATLAIRTFPDGNHNIDIALTGSLTEMENMTSRVKSAGYYDVQLKWLKEHVLER